MSHEPYLLYCHNAQVMGNTMCIITSYFHVQMLQ